MKMLFFSSDEVEVEQLTHEFMDAGIPCEIRSTDSKLEGFPTQAELWVRNDRDCHRALMLCVQRNVGFARRPEPVPEDDYELQGNHR